MSLRHRESLGMSVDCSKTSKTVESPRHRKSLDITEAHKVVRHQEG